MELNSLIDSRSFSREWLSLFSNGGANMNEKNLVQSLFAVIATAFQFLFGGWTLPLKILVTFMTLDYISGVYAAWIKREIDSRVGYKGIARKIGILVLVAVAHLLDMAFSLDAPILQTAAIWYYIGNEGISIAENLALANVPVPETILNALKRLKEEGANEQLPANRKL